jgi:hypothetical protein
MPYVPQRSDGTIDWLNNGNHCNLIFKEKIIFENGVMSVGSLPQLFYKLYYLRSYMEFYFTKF